MSTVAPVFGPRRIILWGLAWSLALTVAEAPNVSGIDSVDWPSLFAWLTLQWMVPSWWLLGCALLWVAQRGARSHRVTGVLAGTLLVCIAHAVLEPVFARTLVPARNAMVSGNMLNMTALMSSLDFYGWASLATYQLWVGLFYGGVLVLAATLVARREAMQRLLHLAALSRGRTETLLNSERLEAQQAQIDPQLLLTVMHEIEARYRVDPRHGERLLTSLVDFLRCAMPGLRERRSTLQRELTLAQAYLGLQAERGLSTGSRVDASASQECLATAFPSLLMLPLLALADDRHATAIRVRSERGVVKLQLVGLGQLPGTEAQDRIRHCLLALHGEDFRLHIGGSGQNQVEIVLGTAVRQGERHVA